MRTRTTFLPFALPDLDESEFEQVKEALESGWITTGPKTKEFERQFAATVGARHAIAVNSCTAAMHLALEAIGLQRGDEVITTPYTFAATAEVIRYFDAKPVFVDIEPISLNIDPSKIEKAVTSKTRAIIPVHIAGVSADLASIQAIANKHSLRIIEDAAHAFPSTFQGQPIGSISDFTCFSFYATKTITTGEGGMITTNNDEWADRCRIMALHGISRDAWKRYTEQGNWYYEVVAPGYKYNLTDIASGIGLAQLKKSNHMLSRRKEIASQYNRAFGNRKEFQIPLNTDTIGHAWHLYLLRLNAEHCAIGRNEFIDEMKTRKIGTSVHFIPLHMHPYYRTTYKYQDSDFPIASTEYKRVVSLPLYSKMKDSDVTDVIECVLDILDGHRG